MKHVSLLVWAGLCLATSCRLSTNHDYARLVTSQHHQHAPILAKQKVSAWGVTLRPCKILCSDTHLVHCTFMRFMEALTTPNLGSLTQHSLPKKQSHVGNILRSLATRLAWFVDQPLLKPSMHQCTRSNIDTPAGICIHDIADRAADACIGFSSNPNLNIDCSGVPQKICSICLYPDTLMKRNAGHVRHTLGSTAKNFVLPSLLYYSDAELYPCCKVPAPTVSRPRLDLMAYCQCCARPLSVTNEKKKFILDMRSHQSTGCSISAGTSAGASF